MKIALLCLVAVGIVGAAHVDVDHVNFATYLHNMEQTHHFEKMTPEEKVTYGELVMAAEKGPDALNSLIDRITFDKLMRLIERKIS